MLDVYLATCTHLTSFCLSWYLSILLWLFVKLTENKVNEMKGDFGNQIMVSLRTFNSHEKILTTFMVWEDK